MTVKIYSRKTTLRAAALITAPGRYRVGGLEYDAKPDDVGYYIWAEHGHIYIQRADRFEKEYEETVPYDPQESAQDG
jgi:hypothetical protein